jgi:hypothetical protein
MATDAHALRMFPLPNNSPARTEFIWKSATPLDERDQSALNVGAHHCSRLNNMPCDTLDIAEDREHMRTQLREGWGITSTTEARQTVGRLLDGMHSATYEMVFPLVSAIVDKTDGHAPDLHREYLALRAYSRNEPVDHWIAAYDALHQLRTIAKPFSGFTSPNWPTHIRAWDFARLVYIVRVARHIGYLDDDESWAILRANLSAARSYYPNWRQFGQGVIIGRTYWRALTDVATAGAYGQTAADAVNAMHIRPDSPWRRLPLQPTT